MGDSVTRKAVSTLLVVEAELFPICRMKGLDHITQPNQEPSQVSLMWRRRNRAL